MMQIFPDRESAKPLIKLVLGFACIGAIVLIAETPKFFANKSIIVSVVDVPTVAPVHSTSTIPYTFDPLKKNSASTTPQFILLSFDGSKSNEMWKDTIDFADKMNASGTPLHFTYFINSAYMLAPENNLIYKPPHEEIGHSDIGYAESSKTIDERIGEVNKAISRGHEISSHAAGHWKGANWSIGDWRQEFASFSDLLFNLEKNNPQYKFTNKLNLKVAKIKGFRAPSLSLNENMYKALSADGFYYDSSEINMNDEWPKRDTGGVWHIPISTVYFPFMNQNIIAVDYSIWMNETNGENTLKKGTQEWQNALDGLVEGYMKHFDKSYKTNRVPMVIDNHFSTWNDGVYWEAMKGFAEKVCGRPHVRCTTFSNLVGYMETK